MMQRSLGLGYPIASDTRYRALLQNKCIHITFDVADWVSTLLTVVSNSALIGAQNGSKVATRSSLSVK
jgi:hypothetical protein